MAIKVLIIDDSALVRESLSQVLNSDPEITVIATASDPIFGAKKINAERPDVIVLDIEMARMDGLTFLRKMNESVDPIPCVICSSMVSEGSENARKAIEYGAAELIHKPSLGTRKFLEESTTKICGVIKTAYNSQFTKKRPTLSDKLNTPQPKLSADVILTKPSSNSTPIETTEKIVVVGASTGGTEALKDFLTQLPADAPGIVIVQHMPEKFTNAFANRLDGLCKITVKEAKNGDSVIQGQALIAPGNYHTLLKRSGTRYYVEVKDGPLVSRHRPSVDVLFRSAARYAGQNSVGIIMTGMGDDGAKGLKEMHDTGAFTIAQDEATCIVYGMPGEAVKNGSVDKIVPLQNIAQTMLNAVRK